jgi:uncharacterized protein YebE (UPF0316 family)
MKLLILFIVLNIVNVILQTVKSIATIKCGKTMAALINAIAYGIYTIVLVYTNADFPLYQKVLVVAFSNLIGVFVVKYIEELNRKAKLWKIEFTVKSKDVEQITELLTAAKVPYNCLATTNDYCMINAFCQTKNESEAVINIIQKFHAKFFVSETKDIV